MILVSNRLFLNIYFFGVYTKSMKEEIRDMWSELFIAKFRVGNSDICFHYEFTLSPILFFDT